MKSINKPNDCKPGRHQSTRAFTFVELLASLAALLLLAAMIVPALARSKPDVQALRCRENLRQLGTALAMYSGDNHDFFPPNMDDGADLPGYSWCPGDVAGGMPPGSPVPDDLYNPDILADPARCLVTTYLRNNIGVFSCPADPRFGTYTGTNSARKGMTVPAARSVSMNQGLGTMDPGFALGGGHSGKPTLKVYGPWLPGTHALQYSSYQTFGKQTDFGLCSPGAVFVLIDEDPYSINDAGLAVCAARPQLIDWPASYHDNGCGVSFADGHAETHVWKSAIEQNGTLARSPGPPGTGSYADWFWLASHATKSSVTGTVP